MSLYRRPNSSHFWCRFTIRGREIRQSTGTANRQEAEEFETELRARYWRQIKLGESFHTFCDAGKRWLEETEKKTKAKDEHIIDWLSYERDPDTDKIISQRLANVPLREINRDIIDAARTKLAEGLSKTTVNYYMGVLRAILRKAHSEWGWLDALPKVPMYKRVLDEPQWLTRAQLKTLLKHLPPHSADLAIFAVATGLRKANITGLTWDRVDLKRKTAYIPGSEAKAGRGIPVALNDDAIDVLKRWRGKHDRWVFTYQGERIKDVTTRAWRDACKRAGVPGFRFHDLRHTWASWQVQAETPLSVLQEMGGWASFEMVRRYSHLSPGHLQQYADRTLLGTPRKAKAKKSA